MEASQEPEEASPHSRRRPWKAGLYVLAALALLAGLWGRFHQLGIRPLAEDEYYFVRSVQFILDTGVPAFPDGGYYLRGLLPQYVTAGAVLLFGDNGFAYRLPGAVLSLLTAVLSFFYARRYAGKPAALVIALALLVSSWEIEFARFARMYSAFQCVTVAFLLSLDSDRFRTGIRQYLPHLLAVIGVLTHELGIVLLPLLLIKPATDWLEKRRVATGYLAASLAVIAFSVAYEFLSLAVDASGIEGPASQPDTVGLDRFVAPAFPVWSVSSVPHVNLALIVAAVLAAVLGAWASRRPWDEFTERRCLLAMLLVFSVSHQFVPAGIVLGVLVFRHWLPRRGSLFLASWAVLGLSVIAAAGWMAYAVARPETMETAAPGDWMRAVRRSFFGWPDLFTASAEPWFRNLPLLAAAVAAALLWQFAAAAREPLAKVLRNPTLPLLCFLVFFGFVNTRAGTTRYSHFLYPVVLVVIACSACRVASRFGVAPRTALNASAGCLGAVFLFSGDFNPRHIARVASPEVSFRQGRYSRYDRHWYQRPDFATPARFLNGHTAPGDLVVLSGRVRPIPFYLTRPYVLFYPTWSPNFQVVARENGTVDKWSSAPLLSTDDQLREHSRNARTIWLARPVNPGKSPHDFEIEEVWESRLLDAERASLSVDGRVEIVRIRLRGESSL